MRMHFCVRKAAFACFAVMLVASPLLAEDLSLPQAVETAINNNPNIAAGRLSADAAKQSARGAKALTNPEIVVAPSAVGNAGSDSAVLFSQPLEINGGRRVRGEIASHEAAAACFDANALRRDIVLRVNLGYWDVARAQELVKLNQDNMEYLETVRTAVQKQNDVGAVPGAQLLKMDVELARSRQELSQVELLLSLSKAELNSLMGRPTDTSFTVSEPLVFSETLLDRKALAASALTARPEVASASAQLDASRSRISAARLLRVPDLALQARKESFDSSDTNGGVAIAIELPIFDWGSAGAEKRRAQIAAQGQEKQLQAVRNEVLLNVEQAVQRVNTASQVVREYQGGVVAKSEELATMARKGYEKGANTYLELLEAQRTLRSVRSDYYSALAEHAKAVAQLEWAVGRVSSRLGSPEVKK